MLEIAALEYDSEAMSASGYNLALLLTNVMVSALVMIWV